MTKPKGPSPFETLLEIWSRRRRAAIITMAITFTASAAIAFSLPDLYRSTSTVLVQREHVAETMVKPSVTAEVETRLRTIREEILSRAHLQELIDRFHLYPKLRGSVPTEALIERMRREIRVEARNVEPGAAHGETIALGISFQGMVPEQVADVTNALAETYVMENQEARARQTSGTSEFLQTQLEAMKSRMDAQAARLSDFNMRHIGTLPQQVGTNLATIERLSAQLAANRDRQARMEDRADRIEADAQRASAEATGSAVPQSGRGETRLATLERQLALLRSRYSDTYPDVVQLQNEVAQLKASGDADAPAEGAPSRGSGRGSGTGERRVSTIGAYGRSEIDSIRREVARLQAEEARIEGQIASYQGRVESAPSKDQELATLTRDYEATKVLYQSLLQRDEDARMADNLEKKRIEEEIRVLDPAVPARLPAAPNRWMLLGLGLVVSMGLVLFVVVVVEHWDTSFHSVDGIRMFTKVPVLASIPVIDVSSRYARWGKAGFAAIASAVGITCIIALAWLVAHENVQLVTLLSRGGS